MNIAVTEAMDCNVKMPVYSLTAQRPMLARQPHRA
jgi:hypothetical protein